MVASSGPGRRRPWRAGSERRCGSRREVSQSSSGSMELADAVGPRDNANTKGQPGTGRCLLNIMGF